MRVEKISINKERLVFQLILTMDNQQELMEEFIGKLNPPLMTNISCKIIEKEAKLAIKCSSKDAYKEVYRQLDELIIRYL